MIVFRANDATEEDSDGKRIGADHGGDKDGDGGVHGMLNEWSVHSDGVHIRGRYEGDTRVIRGSPYEIVILLHTQYHKSAPAE